MQTEPISVLPALAPYSYRVSIANLADRMPPLVAVFPSIASLDCWLESGAYVLDAAFCGGVALPARDGIYNCTTLFVGANFKVYVMDYLERQSHPNVPFPYIAWAVVIRGK